MNEDRSPSNGRKRNCSRVHRFGSFILVILSKMRANQQQVSTLRSSYVWHAGCLRSSDYRTPHGSSAIALRGKSKTCVRDSRAPHSSGRSGCQRPAVSRPHRSAGKDFRDFPSRCGEVLTVGRGSSPSSAVEGLSELRRGSASTLPFSSSSRTRFSLISPGTKFAGQVIIT